MTDGVALILSLVLVVALVALTYVSLARDSDDDHGDGRGWVRIPKPHRTPPFRPRTFLFLVSSVVASVVILGLRRPSPFASYDHAVERLAATLTGSPAQTALLSGRITPAVEVLGAAYLVILALAARGPVVRRLLLAGQALVLLALSILAQGLLVALAVWTGLPIRPVGFVALLLALVVAAYVNAGAIFANFVLPRRTTVPNLRPRYAWDSVLAAGSLVVALAVVAVLFAWMASLEPTNRVRVLVPLYGTAIIFLFSPALLIPFGLRRRDLPGPGRTVPIDVITPAYNEEAGIQLTLASIDAAAARYGGPVRVIVSNDGSSDRTEQLAWESIADFRAARGVVLTAPNGGKAVALNRALDAATAAIVVRMDGDCVMGEDALRYVAGWFDDPAIGAVGALMMPRQDGRSWFHKMRAIECLFQFGLARRGQSVVDGMTTIPGTFEAFRREPVVSVGGVVDGMNGEDSELVMQLGRLGYRAVLDPRIRCFEDVPSSVAAFLEQRTRWSRAGLHITARHSPARSGLAGPRVWLWMVRRMFSWLSIMLGLIGPLFAAVGSVMDPSYRRTIVTIAGLYVFAALLYFAVSVAVIARYRQWRLLVWLPTWYAFALLRRVAMLEALLTLPMRPVRPFGGGRPSASEGHAPSPAGLSRIH
jgi:cellulose synthase/poly-beta-1,6-N-acetylglucosamine synthase-like glycosyltransferase